jgi:hypothetical protein
MKRLVAVLMLMFAVTLSVGPRASFADTRGPVQRVVSGHVLDDGDKPVKDAVVYLKDTRTLAVKSYLSGADGAYRFGQLSTTTDYEIWAESGPKKSKTRTISSFDTKSQFTIDLKL